jgi:hypothetical protein
VEPRVSAAWERARRGLARVLAGRRAVDWLLIVVLTTAWVVVFARAVDNGLRTGQATPWIAVASAPTEDDYPYVVAPMPEIGLEVGDRLEAVDGRDLRGASTARFYDGVSPAARERGSARLSVSRDGARFETTLPLRPQRWWWMHFPSAVLAFGIGLLILLRAPNWHLARRTFVLFALVSALDVWTDWRASGSGLRGEWYETHLVWLLITFTGGLAIWNCQEFTESARPVPRLHRALAIAGLLTLPADFVIRYHLPSSWAVQRFSLVFMFSVGASLLVVGLARAYRLASPLERRQLRWVVLGFYLGRVGGVVGIVLSVLLSMPLVGRVLHLATALLFPIGILFAVTNQRWLDIDRLISATASYTILGLAVVGGVLAGIPDVSRAVAPALGIDEAALRWSLTMGLVVATIPAHALLWPRIDQRMFGRRHERNLGFERLLDELGSYASVEDLVRLASERVDALLEPESIAVYARTNGRFAPVFSRGRTSPLPHYEASSPLVHTLLQRGRPLWAGASELDGFDRAALETIGVELIVPIRGREGLAGFTCLGRKRSGDIYLPQEITLLGAVASRCSEVLLRLTAEPDREPGRQVFRRDGELWTIASGGKEIRLRDMRGLHYLATLLREPGREFRATDLVSLAGALPPGRSREDPALQVVRGLGSGGEGIDARARAAYRERLREIEADCAEAERHGDLGQLARSSEEREMLLAELVSAANGSRAASHDERARIAVTKAIGASLARIAERHPELGAHLSATIRRGWLCAYVPDPRIPVEWET